MREANDGRLADRVVLCAGAPEALETALACVATCGVLQLFAPTPPGHRPEIDLNRIWSEQIALTTTYGAAPLDLEEITHRRSRSSAPAFSRIRSRWFQWSW